MAEQDKFIFISWSLFIYYPPVLDESEDKYFLGDEGKKYCRGGKTITDATACKKACDYLNIEISEELTAGEVCYKNGVNTKCDQNGRNGQRASLICEKGNVTDKIMFVYNITDTTLGLKRK